MNNLIILFLHKSQITNFVTNKEFSIISYEFIDNDSEINLDKDNLTKLVSYGYYTKEFISGGIKVVVDIKNKKYINLLNKIRSNKIDFIL